MNLPRNSTHYVIPGTKFFRLGSRQISCLEWRGTNLQNQEKSLRSMYYADDGKLLNQRDQSGAEALIVAYLCRNGKFRSLFLNNIKPHVFVALHLFADRWQEEISQQGLDIKCDIRELTNLDIHLLKAHPFWKQVDKLIKSSDSWPPSRRYYYIAKQVCHSSNYGIRANAFCINTLDKSKGKIALKREEAEKFLHMYHTLFPEIREWHQEVEYQVRETRMLYNLLGHPIRFTGQLKSENDIKEALSAVPQSTVACITHRAVTEMQSFVEQVNYDWDFLNNNHDSFLEQCPENEWEECQKVMKQFLNMELENFRGEKFTMKSEGGTGMNWGPYDEHKNLDGLKEVSI